MIGPGSAYFHLNPNQSTLVWDRLPMGLAFFSLFVALVVDTFELKKIEKYLIVPVVLIGVFLTIHWVITKDLRFNMWVQLMPVLAAVLLPLLFRSNALKGSFLILAAIFYILAKFAELYDKAVFELAYGLVSGHTLKHILAAIAILQLVKMYEYKRI